MISIDPIPLEVSPETSILQTLEVIGRGGYQIALVVDSTRRLLGTVTDGDVRRSILRKVALDGPVGGIMNPHPIVGRSNEGASSILEKMKSKALRQIPIVDDTGRVLSLQVIDQLISTEIQENWVVLMAGGEGRRLFPLTEKLPKPLLPVGNKPILETIVANFADHGFRNIFISVNYKADLITDYFGSGDKWGAKIRYLKEDQRLGTAGPLQLLPEPPKVPIIVMNGDLLTTVNFRQLISFHEAQKADVTVGVREFDFEVPYGVIHMKGEKVVGLEEKPLQRFYVAAGIYVISPHVLNRIPKNQPLDMPELISGLIAEKGAVSAYPIREYWIDIGRMDDFQKANVEFAQVFSNGETGKQK
jgi:dTDP-glucose pyrophosphorylase